MSEQRGLQLDRSQNPNHKETEIEKRINVWIKAKTDQIKRKTDPTRSGNIFMS